MAKVKFSIDFEFDEEEKTFHVFIPSAPEGISWNEEDIHEACSKAMTDFPDAQDWEFSLFIDLGDEA
ncbi:hypothetical protein [Paremcibacter congregatus]|uniref:Uncharacterized protein n=2 Tax=Paremcibacter congregatus TaxID=2043170 RepID=A0A2G4YVB8_9PROT|nr:hypothetical protein [Paremcibacter congregatus]PHZ86294.1 hypothetical protein CRD36_06410 [Paremcibacter congregatus]QDE27261.1 hypothetical protein FIV45_08175 [Paremcibacter congregatus]QDE27295.1 hypothetical protein FIV45_08345 [Paremcibacter congregatus]